MINNDLFCDENEYPLFPKLFSLNPTDIFSQNDEIASLSTQIERLNLDVHTQSLRVEVERVKLQKLRSRLKRIKRKLIPNNRIITQFCADIVLLPESMETRRQLYERELSLPLTLTLDIINSPYSSIRWESHRHEPSSYMSFWKQFTSYSYPLMPRAAWSYLNNLCLIKIYYNSNKYLLLSCVSFYWSIFSYKWLSGMC